MVFDESLGLNELDCLVNHMHRHQQEVPGLNHPGESHEKQGVHGERCGGVREMENRQRQANAGERMKEGPHQGSSCH